MSRYLLILASILLMASCSGDTTLTPPDPPGDPEWRELNRIPVTGDLRAVWGSGPDDIFATGWNGADIIHFNGREWSLQTSSQYSGFLDLWGSSSSDVYAAGTTIARYDGTEWTTVYSAPNLRLNGVWGSSASDVYFAGTGGLLLHWDGAVFEPIDMGTISDLRDVWGSGPGDVYVVGIDSLYHYDGTSWEIDTSIDPGDMWQYDFIAGAAADDIVLTGRATARFDGTSWSFVPAERAIRMTSIWCAGTNDYYGTSLTSVYRFDGAAWSEHFRTPRDKGPQYLSDVWVDPRGGLYTVGMGGAVWRERRGDVVLLNGTTSEIVDIWAASDDNVFAGARSGEVLRWDGYAWREENHFTNDGIYSLWGVSEDRVYACTTRGQLFMYDGARWREVALPEPIGPVDVWEFRGDVLVVAGRYGIARRDRGRWTVTRTDTPNASVWGRDGKDVYVAGGQGLLHSDGDTWTVVPHEMEYIYDLFGLRTGEIYAATATGLYVNHAGEWQLIPASPGFPLNRVWGTSPTDLYFTDHNCRTRIYHNDGKESEVVYRSDRHCLRALWGTAPDNVYAGGLNGALVQYSTD